ncbi:MAG: class I SAM-dependent methyltransferase [Burkholderiaceae bacterium]
MKPVHALAATSPWVERWSHLVPRGARVLDVACGSGRHVRWFAARGACVTGIDRDAAAARPLRDMAEIMIADLESGPWPLTGRRFDAVVVTNYLWRALFPTLVESVDAGGVLIYETFAAGNDDFGKPSNPNFLLAPGELLQATADLRVVAYEDGFLTSPERCVQRICARRERSGVALPTPLDAQVKSFDSEDRA